MNFTARIGCAVLLLASLASAQTGVVYDPRLPTPAPKVSSTVTSRITALVKAARRTGSWKTGYVGMCADQTVDVIGQGTGSFTAPRTAQVAYLYSACIEVPNTTQQGLVVMQGGTVVAHYTFTDHFMELYSLKDINQNGTSELALVRELSGQGTTSRFLAVAELSPVRRFLMLEEVTYDDCGNMGTEGWKAQVIRVAKGPAPRYSSQALNGRCTDVTPFLQLTRQAAPAPLLVAPKPTGWVSAPKRP
ncbi:hypothetical protein [Deinococcus enclensis]|uniref:Uncharacterized protein n=1 Tax=Deinococcus enclensis TaxID=1049582 RepID=A0ABT9MG18_9DEIO|nr:hypothetical protein [Deinococcus enclensis]MDP9765547.1 hypothetical protein [Deinococcus enclensis]